VINYGDFQKSISGTFEQLYVSVCNYGISVCACVLQCAAIYRKCTRVVVMTSLSDVRKDSDDAESEHDSQKET
jgi:hypothetical protein